MAKTSIQKSTIVRTFKVLERLAPDVGAKWAERLWFTIPSAGSPRPPEGGEPFEVRTGGHVVRGWTWGHGPVVYLVPGWGGYAGQLRAFVRPLVAAGFTVVAHDPPSHGASGPGRLGPRSTDIVECGQALDAVAARFGPAHAVVGHSMGALVAALAMRHGWLGARRLVLVAPMVSAADAVTVFAGRLGFGRRIQQRLATRIERRVGMPMSAFDIAAIAPDLDRTQLLAVHDRDDTETPYVATEALVAGWRDAELLTTHGLGHRRILRDPGVVRTVTNTLVADVNEGLSRSA